jgi:hypothetical protein
MSNDITKVEEFMGIPVRIVEHEQKTKLMPLNDIADGISYDRSTLRKLFHRNERLLGKFSGKVMMTSPQGVQETLCLNRDGVTGLLMKLDLKRIKNPDKQNRILAFQDWAIDVLGKIMDGKQHNIKPFATPEQPIVNISDVVTEELKIADAFSKYAGVDRGIATSIAITWVEYNTKEDLSRYKNLIPKGSRIGLLDHSPPQKLAEN